MTRFTLGDLREALEAVPLFSYLVLIATFVAIYAVFLFVERRR